MNDPHKNHNHCRQTPPRPLVSKDKKLKHKTFSKTEACGRFPRGTHVERDEQHVQGRRLFGGGDGLALELQLAKLRPADAVQVRTGVHVLQQHQQGVTVLVFDWLKIHLTEVLGSQHSLGTGDR